MEKKIDLFFPRVLRDESVLLSVRYLAWLSGKDS